MNRENAVRFIKKLMLVVFAVWFLTFIFIEGAVIAKGRPDADLKGDYVLVLGAGLRGETPSLSLKSRLDKALEYFNSNKDINIIVSGGQGKGESITEAEAMKRYLIEKGIAEHRIIKEDKSTSTKENIEFSKEILDALEKDSKYKIILITNDFHMFRAKMLAERIGLDAAALPAKSPLYIYIKFSIREYFAVIKALLEL